MADAAQEFLNKQLSTNKFTANQDVKKEKNLQPKEYSWSAN